MKQFLLSLFESLFKSNKILLILILFFNVAVFAQTNPASFNLAGGNFSFTTQTATLATYPTNMQGWNNGGTANVAVLPTAASTADAILTPSGSAGTSGLSNLGANGFNFLSSGTSPNTVIGSIALSLNTTGRTNEQVTWTAADQTTGTTRQMNLTLQYRLGITGAFTTVAASTYTTSNTVIAAAQTFTNVVLPSACDNQAVVQLRWIYYESAAQAGGRDAIRLDDITVTSTSSAPTINGTIVAGEYGTHINGVNQQASGAATWYMNWDSTFLYVAIAGTTTSEAGVLYLDKAPIVPVNGGTNADGNLVGNAYDGSNFANLQFRADLVVYFKDGYQEFRTANGTGGWSSPTTGMSYASASGSREIAIPWSSIGGQPTSFNWFGHVAYGGGGAYASVPTENPGSSAGLIIGSSARWDRYYTVSTSLIAPFSRNSYTFTSAADVTGFGIINAYDFTMNSSGRFISRTGNVGGNWTINGNLVMGAGTIYLGSGGSGYGTTNIFGNMNLLGGTFDMDATTAPVNLAGATSSLSIASGATLKLSSQIGGDFNLLGNWSNLGTFTPSGRAVTFNGTTAQTMTGATTFDFLTLNNSSGLTLINTATVNNILTLTSGKITLGTNDLTIGSAGSIVSSATNYVVTNSTGSLIKNAVGNTSFNFPVGLNTTQYTPIALTNTTGTSNLTVNVKNTITNAVTDPARIVNLEWSVNSSAATTATVMPTWVAANNGTAFVTTGAGEIGDFTSSYSIYPTTLATTTTTATGLALASGINKIVVGNTGAVYAAPPVNDNCTGAIALIVDAAAITGNVTGATQSVSAILCNALTGTANDDVWYSFTTGAAGNYNITATGSASFDMVLDLRSGICNGTNIACKDATSAGASEVLSAIGLTASTTYYVRLYDYGSGIPLTKTFTIAVSYIAPPTITSFAASGCVGSSIVVTGTNLSGVTSVKIGGTTATFSANTATSVTFVVPTTATGAIVIIATTGTVTSSTNFTINPLPTAVWSATAIGVCPSVSAQTTTLAYSSTTNSPTLYSIVWNVLPTNSFIAVTDAAFSGASGGGTISLNIPAGANPGTYTGTISVKTVNGCINTALQNFTITINPNPTALIVTPATPSICNGTIQTLVATGSTIPKTAIGGNASASSGTTSYPSPFSVYFGGSKQQFIVLASELTAAGFITGSNLSSIAFNIQALGITPLAQQNFKVKIGHTVASAATTTFISTATTTVFGPATYPTSGTVTTGLNTINFGTNFVWDGTSNIFVETTFSNNNSGVTANGISNFIHSPGGTLSSYFRVDGQTSATVEATTAANFTSTSRPDFVLTGTALAPILWSPTTDLFTNAGATTPYTGTNLRTVYAKPTSTTPYVATASNGSCTTTTNVTVTVKPNTTIATQPLSQTICQGSLLTLSVVGANSTTYAYQWFKNGVLISSAINSSYVISSANVSDNGNYTVQVLGDCGSVVTSSIAVINVKSNVSITSVTSTAVTICSTATATLTANGVAGTNAVLTWWTATGGTGTNLGTTPTITVGPGSYYARVTGDCGIPAEANYTINAISTLDYVNLQFPGSGTICQTGTFTAYGQVYEPGITPGAGQGAGITVEFGYSNTDTDPSTWTNWFEATYNIDAGNNDEYKYILTPPSNGTFYYTFRYRPSTCNWQYGGYSTSGGGFWNGTTNVNGQLIVSPTITPTFTAYAPICPGDTITALPTTSIEGIIGSWSPALNNISTTTYSFTPNSGQCAISTTLTITTGTSTTWVGLPTGWNNGTPTSTSSAIITANYNSATDGGNIVACTLTVSNNSLVNIASGNNVNLNGKITVDMGSTFTLNNNANLVQNTNVVNTGNIIVKRNSSALKRQDYTMWSSPVANQNLLAFSPATLTTRFYTYTTLTNLYSVVASPSTTVFNLAKGYLIRTPNTHPTTPTIFNGQFDGVPNNGPISFTMANAGVTGQKFNATGNPYPSTINLNSFVAANTVSGDERITGTVYFWRKTNSTTSSPGYCTWSPDLINGTGTFVSNNEAQVFNPNGIVQVGQGFIVEAKNASTVINFNNSMRAANNSNQFFKSQNQSIPTGEANRIWLNMTSTAGEFSQTAFGYMTNATIGVDIADAKFFNDGPIALQSLIGSENYTIQSRPVPFDVSDIVPLSFKTTNAGSYTIAIDHTDGLFLPATQDIFLKDNSNNTYTNLNLTPYTFTAGVGEDANRFQIVYQNALSNTIPTFTSNTILVYKKNGSIIINSGTLTMKTVKIFDVRGRLILEKNNVNTSNDQFSLTIANQVVLVQITDTNGTIVTKKVNM